MTRAFTRVVVRAFQSLEEIPKDILSPVPLDPFVGRPLIYRILNDGIVIYSVGRDRGDHGGDLSWTADKIGQDDGVLIRQRMGLMQPKQPPTARSS